jgi:hypothetical protein
LSLAARLVCRRLSSALLLDPACWEKEMIHVHSHEPGRCGPILSDTVVRRDFDVVVERATTWIYLKRDV